MKETIDRWAEYIIPAVFKAEDELLKKHPEWRDRLRNLKGSGEDPSKFSEEYCRAIATIIVVHD